jgi:hypothetical protein
MLLEGTDIRALLQQVRDEYGPEARIVHAERIRSGGVGGFFAKQRFEVAVELDGDGHPAAPGGTANSGTAHGDSDLADSLTGERSPRQTQPSFDDAVAAATAEQGSGRSAIDLVLAALPSVDEAPALRAPATVPAQATPAGTHLPQTSAADEPGRTADADLPIERAAMAAAHHGLTPVGPVAVAAASQPSTAPAPAVLNPPLVLSPAMAASAAAARLIAAAAASVDLGDEAAAPLTAPLTAPLLAAVPNPVAETPALAPVLPLVVAPEPAPEVPMVPTRPGDVLVLLGDPGPAYEAAIGLAARCRVPASLVSVLTARDSVQGVPAESLLHDLLELRLRGAELAHARTAGIVVVDAPFDLVADPHGRAWVAEAVRTVGATAVWAVVDATRRTDDLQRWLGGVPDAEALVVHGQALTSDPQAVHGLGLPVAAHDGVEAPADTTSSATPLTYRRTS